MAFWKDFKDFALKGNVIDMAVGIVVGVAFNKIVNSLVNDVIMPPLGMLLGQVDFKDLRVVLKDVDTLAVGETGEVALRYGMFINSIIEFVIVALSVFVVVKVMNKMMRFRPGAGAKTA
jgi:large conductance mechanosensitive channel